VRFWFDTWKQYMAVTLMVNSCDRSICQRNLPFICLTIPWGFFFIRSSILVTDKHLLALENTFIQQIKVP
jgi:hypothetical protein